MPTLPKVPQFTAVPDLLYRRVENEAVLLHITAGTYYSLNELGMYFWEALKTDSPETVIEQVAAEYEAEPTQIHQDLLLFLEDLVRHGLIHWNEEISA